MSATGLNDWGCRSREVIALVSGKWTLDVLLLLKRGAWRHGELKRHISGISQKVLTQKLRELERAGLVRRREYEDSSVAKVEYSLTDDGTSLVAVVAQMHDWAAENMDRVKSSMARYDRVGARSGADEATSADARRAAGGAQDPDETGAARLQESGADTGRTGAGGRVAAGSPVRSRLVPSRKVLPHGRRRGGDKAESGRGAGPASRGLSGRAASAVSAAGGAGAAGVADLVASAAGHRDSAVTASVTARSGAGQPAAYGSMPLWGLGSRPDDERCEAAVRSRNPRFDGWFVVGITSSGVYCRPSCPGLTTRRPDYRFYATAAGAQQAGFRSCPHCKPDATPGSPEWSLRADLVGRAMRLIHEGVVDREGVAGLARRLDLPERHLHRRLVSAVGASPVALARAQRAQTARTLIENTRMPLGEIAVASGFTSVRQFDDTVRAVFGASPSELRADGDLGLPAPGTPVSGTGPVTVSLRLPVRAPFDVSGTFRFLAARAVPGVEEADRGRYRRALRLPLGLGTVTLAPLTDRAAVFCTLRLAELRDVAAAVQRCRRLLDADADAVAVDAAFAADPTLGPLVRATPGCRVPGTVDAAETALLAVLGQRLPSAAARVAAARLASGHGEPLGFTDGSLARVFPSPEVVAGVDPATLRLPGGQADTLVALASALATGRIRLDPGVDREEARRRLQTVPGVDPWTAAYVTWRALGDPDVFLPDDPEVQRGAQAAGLPTSPGALAAHAERWRPWRAYAAARLAAAGRERALPARVAGQPREAVAMVTPRTGG